VAQSYTPTFFTDLEWRFLLAACALLIPSDELGPGAVELGVPEFLDRHMQTPYATGATWYREGPFFPAGREFGYQGGLSLREIIRTGIRAVDSLCAEAFNGRRFAELDDDQRISVLNRLECEDVDLEGVPAGVFFAFLLSEVRLGYFSDPVHGGNRDMGSWKMIGYPGLQQDYRDWIGFRHGPLPLAPVGLASKKG
jgi:gluconate 2-dehydrogenase gamma chain